MNLLLNPVRDTKLVVELLITCQIGLNNLIFLDLIKDGNSRVIYCKIARNPI